MESYGKQAPTLESYSLTSKCVPALINHARAHTHTHTNKCNQFFLKQTFKNDQDLIGYPAVAECQNCSGSLRSYEMGGTERGHHPSTRRRRARRL